MLIRATRRLAHTQCIAQVVGWWVEIMDLVFELSSDLYTGEKSGRTRMLLLSGRLFVHS